jgi:hypothetical protein
METTVKCKKCGRMLKNPASVVMGMGPKCAGVSMATGKKLQVGNRHHTGKTYNSMGTDHSQIPLMLSQMQEKKTSRREHALIQREERRRLFQERRAFQCGLWVRAKTPLIYEPVGEKEWKDSLSGKIVPQEQLQAILIRSQLI